MNSKKLSLLYVFTLLLIFISLDSFGQVSSLEGTITSQTNSFKAIAKSVAIVAVILGLIAGAIAVMWDFKDNKTLKQVLTSIAVGLLILASISGVVSYMTSQVW